MYLLFAFRKKGGNKAPETSAEQQSSEESVEPEVQMKKPRLDAHEAGTTPST